MTEDRQSITGLLARARGGDATAIGELFTVVYDQLKQLARAQRRHRQEATLNTTALVHETFLKLAGQDHLAVRDRGHFMAVAAMAMRQILLDHARARLAAKRGGGRQAISFEEIETALGGRSDFSEIDAEVVLALDDSIARLAQKSERQGRVVECRFFAGLSIEETAEAIGTSPATVKRDWAMAQAWLYRDLQTRLG
ncbi:MAG: ECF-type sigma factor [Gemmatimonadetes bacterium]|nr:ECF-type sigma factor [Gemmatimonadota bacterium]